MWTILLNRIFWINGVYPKKKEYSEQTCMGLICIFSLNFISIVAVTIFLKFQSYQFILLEEKPPYSFLHFTTKIFTKKTVNYYSENFWLSESTEVCTFFVRILHFFLLFLSLLIMIHYSHFNEITFMNHKLEFKTILTLKIPDRRFSDRVNKWTENSDRKNNKLLMIVSSCENSIPIHMSMIRV